MTAPAVDRIVGALRVGGWDPREESGGWRARCPAHNGEHRNLSVDVGRDGNAVIRCRSRGCTYESVMQALDLEPRDGFADSNGGRGPAQHDTTTLMARTNATLTNYTPAIGTATETDAAPAIPIMPVIDEQIVTTFHERLLNDHQRLAWLAERRGITRETVVRFQIGHDGQRYYIPVRDTDDQCRNIRRYDPDARRADDKMISWRPGYGEARLFPLSTLEDSTGPVTICEGEMDTLLALQHGLSAVTGTGGAGTWRDEWNEHFRNRDVVVAYDHDAAGRAGAANVARKLHGIAASVRIHAWDDDAPDGFDVTDFLTSGGTIETLRARFDAVAVVTPLATPTDATSDGSASDRATDGETYTDVGNGRRLAKQHRATVRHATGLGWLDWNGARWEPDETGAVDRKAKATAERIWRNAGRIEDEDKRKKAVAHAMRTLSAAGIANMKKMASTELSIATKATAFDTNLLLLNTPSGTIDLRNGVLRPHNPADLITKITGTGIDLRAECPRFLSFLDRIFAAKAELIRFVQRVIGYCLTGLTVEQALFICYGTGANGKSTLLETLRDVWNDYAQNADFSTLTNRRDKGGASEDIARLRGARLVTAIESGADAAFNEAVIKQLTGGDTITARRLYQGSFEYIPQFKLLIATNHRPQVRGTDHAIWRRLYLIPFGVTIPDAEKDPALKEKLRAEAPGILRWALEGCLAWQREGLNPPPDVLAATAQYREEQDVLADFFAAHVVVAPGVTEGATALYAKYREWADGSSEKAMSGTAFGLALNERGYHVVPDRSRRAPARRMGLRLRDLSDAAPAGGLRVVAGSSSANPPGEMTSTGLFENNAEPSADAPEVPL
jgi:putative DNA primase/helicase